MGGGKVEVPNPFRECESLAAAETLTGSPLELPEAPEKVSVMNDSMIEATLESGACVRKAAGAEDISGDYTDYTQVETVDGVTLKGGEDGFRLAVWADGGYSYALSLAPGAPRPEWLDMLSPGEVS